MAMDHTGTEQTTAQLTTATVPPLTTLTPHVTHTPVFSDSRLEKQQLETHLHRPHTNQPAAQQERQELAQQRQLRLAQQQQWLAQQQLHRLRAPQQQLSLQQQQQQQQQQQHSLHE